MLHHAGLIRSLSRQLEVLREASGLSRTELATQMHCSQAKISRILTGDTRRIAYADILLMMDLLHADEQSRVRILDLWAQITMNHEGLTPFADVLRPGEVEYFDALRYADVANLHCASIFPTLLRTPAYHRAILTRVELRAAQAEIWAEALPQIQASRNPLRQVSLILDESAFLRWNVAGFHEQLDRVLQAHLDGMRIRVIPLSQPLQMSQAFSILSWRDDAEATLMNVEWRHHPIDWVREKKHRDHLELLWTRLLAVATDADDLPAIVELAHQNATTTNHRVLL